MSSFTTDLIVKSCSPTHWELMQEFFFYYDKKDVDHGITVPEGFVTDFASVPRHLWSIYPPTGRYTKAAVLHDFLYSKESHLSLDRKQSDEIFLDGMKALGVKRSVRYPMYWGVRIGGRKIFKKGEGNINVNLMV